MFPTLISIGPLAISTLGFFIAVGFLLGSFLIWKKGKEEGYDEEILMDSIFLTAISGLIGARLWYVLWRFSDFNNNLLNAFSVVRLPGFSLLGAFLAGTVALAIFCHQRKWDFFKTGDVFVFGLCLGQIFGLIGSFFDGSFYGLPTNLPWGIKFPGLDQQHHPTQLYLLLPALLIFKSLFVFDKNYRTYEWYKGKRGDASPGFLFLSYAILFSGAIFIVDFFINKDLLCFKWFSCDQFFWLLVFFLSAGLLYSRSGINLGLGDKLKNFKIEPKKEAIKVIQDYKDLTPAKRQVKKPQFHVKTGMEAK